MLLGEDGDDADAFAMGGHHDSIGAGLADAELGFQNRDDEFARRVIVVDQNDLVQLRPLGS